MTDFASFAMDHGLILRHPIPDGMVHRVPTTGHPHKKNGAYLWDGRSGWVQAWDIHSEAIPFRGERADPPAARLRPVKDARIDHEMAVREAQQIIGRSTLTQHPYLARKGFPDAQGLVDGGVLVIPMMDATRYPRLVGCQRITEEGEKKFLYGTRAKMAVHHHGRGCRDVLVEGYATGLSVRAALERMYEKARIVVCFSAGNLAAVAGLYPRAIVVADNDESKAGQLAAEKTGLPWVMPPTVGQDANDLMLAEGMDAVIAMLKG